MIPQPGTATQVLDAFADPSWWAYGLALHERLPGDVPAAGPADQTAAARLAGWRAAFGTGGLFARRLADAGLDEATLLALLAESPESLAARVSRPAWVDVVERAVRRAAPPDEVRATTWRDAFAVPLRPFVLDAAERMAERARALPEPGRADLDAITARFASRLSRRLVGIAARTFVHEHNRGVVEHGLAGFARRSARPAALARLCTDYPVLARLLGQACTQAVESTVELLGRFAADRAMIVDALLGGVDPGTLTSLEAGAGDTHRRGRSVAILTFASGARVVYKPRDLTVHQRFTTLVSWLNTRIPGLDLEKPAAVLRPGYGWMAFVPRAGLTDAVAATAFYRRQGALLALLHVVRAADVHCENLIAAGDQPVLVDTEALCQAGLRVPATAIDPAARALAASVHRTGLLPMLVAGDSGVVEVSALGGERGQAAETATLDWALVADGTLAPVRRAGTFAGADNRPRLGAVDLDPAAHEQALLDGFRAGYDAILRGRTEFGALLAMFAGAEVRVVLRHTRGYGTLLAESTRPELLTDALERDRALDLLWVESAADPARWRVCAHEQADLWTHDVPLFTAHADATALSSSDGQVVPDMLDRPGLAAAMATLHGLSELDRGAQEWIISATLATLRATVEHRDAAPLPVAPVAAPPERLLAAACAIADGIVARSMADRDRVGWLGLEPVDDRRWLLLPLGAGLACGYTGVALFFAQLAELTGIDRYATAARQALVGLPALYELLAARQDLVAAVGRGGWYGFGGVAYGLARLATLLDDDGLRESTARTVALAAAAPSAQPGIAMGTAGCLAAMTAVHTELGLDSAALLAKECADHLSSGLPDLPAGFANGRTGVDWALGTAPAAPATGSTGWCAGLAGVAAARAAFADEEEAATLITRLADQPLRADLSLCHGELGVAEALSALQDAGHDTGAALRKRAGLVIGAIDRHGTPCGTPGGVATPGLLTGLAGIGYGLLRLGFAERVPSVLLFGPTPRQSGRGDIKE